MLGQLSKHAAEITTGTVTIAAVSLIPIHGTGSIRNGVLFARVRHWDDPSGIPADGSDADIKLFTLSWTLFVLCPGCKTMKGNTAGDRHIE